MKARRVAARCERASRLSLRHSRSLGLRCGAYLASQITWSQSRRAASAWELTLLVWAEPLSSTREISRPVACWWASSSSR